MDGPHIAWALDNGKRICDQRARRLIVESRAWEDNYIAGSNHRLVSCVVKLRSAGSPTASFDAGDPRFPGGHCRIRRSDLKTPQLRTTAARELKAGSKQAKEMIIEQRDPCCTLGTLQSVEKYRGDWMRPVVC